MITETPQVALTQELIEKRSNSEPLDQIYQINLSSLNLSKIDAVEIIKQIRALNLSNNDITMIENLNVLTDLRELNLSFNSIKKIRGLENNKLLTSLFLVNNMIEKIDNLGHLNKLTKLFLDNNRIATLQGVENLKELKVLSVRNNQITRLDRLVNNLKLEELYASGNLIEKIGDKEFDCCTNLLTLDISCNKLKNITFLLPLKNLEVYKQKTLIISFLTKNLNLEGNCIEILDRAVCLKALENLNLSKNQLIITNKLHKIFPNIYTCDLSDNSIMSDYDVKFVGKIDNLIDVTFTNNPFWTESQKLEFKENYPWIEVIDGEEIHKPGTKFSRELEKIKDEYFDTETEENIKKFLDDSLFLGKNANPANALNKSMNSSFYRTSNSSFYNDGSGVGGAKKTPLMYIRPNSSNPTTKTIGGKKFEVIDNQSEYNSYIEKLSENLNELRSKYISIIASKQSKKGDKLASKKDDESESFSLDIKFSKYSSSLKSTFENVESEKLANDKFQKGEFIATREEREEGKAKEKNIKIRKQAFPGPVQAKRAGTSISGGLAKTSEEFLKTIGSFGAKSGDDKPEKTESSQKKQGKAAIPPSPLKQETHPRSSSLSSTLKGNNAVGIKPSGPTPLIPKSNPNPPEKLPFSLNSSGKKKRPEEKILEKVQKNQEQRNQLKREEKIELLNANKNSKSILKIMNAINSNKIIE